MQMDIRHGLTMQDYMQSSLTSLQVTDHTQCLARVVLGPELDQKVKYGSKKSSMGPWDTLDFFHEKYFFHFSFIGFLSIK